MASETLFSTPIIVFDLETTDCDEHDITEVGAIALDRYLDRLGGFHSFVKPTLPVSDRVMVLTGHAPEDLETADGWVEVAGRFERWVQVVTGRNLKQVRLAAWGNYFDINVLRNNYKRYGGLYPFSGTCLDVKTAAMMWLALRGQRTDSCSVESVAKEMGLVPEGAYHSAIVDAKVTADIFRKVMFSLRNGVYIGDQYLRVTMMDQ